MIKDFHYGTRRSNKSGSEKETVYISILFLFVIPKNKSNGRVREKLRLS